QAAAGTFTSGAGFTAELPRSAVPEHAGYLAFVIEPWAEVHVKPERTGEWQHVLTTPSARRIALPAGRYGLKFRNPFFPEVTREVEVREGETLLVEHDFEGEPEAPPAAAVDPPPPPRPADDEPIEDLEDEEAEP